MNGSATRKIMFLNFFLSMFVGLSRSATVDTLSIYSDAMDKDIKCVVITPDSYNNRTAELPVIYLLHGYSNNYSTWIKKVPGLAEQVDHYQLIVVCPDGGFDSWYWDSPVDTSYRYETHIINEVIPFIDDHYRTIKAREGRAISGLSMGGQGAFYLAFRHLDLFGACGSQSGGVDIRPFPKKWGMAKWLGTYADHPEVWEKHTIINMVCLLPPGSLKIAIDCGTDDFFYTVNRKLHEKLAYMNIPHDYTIRPGKHSWDYWRNSVKYQLLFFNDYFHKNTAEQ